MIRPDARTKLTGEAVFGTDLFEKGMLHGALVPSPIARGRIVRLDVRPALEVPGVVAAIGPTEVERLLGGKGDRDRPVFPTASITYHQQPLAAVAATTLEAAREGARAVRVDAASEVPFVELDQRFPEWPDAAAGRSSEVIAHVLARGGDLPEAIRSADFVHAETYRTHGIHQVALEPHACLARVVDGRWHVRTTTQSPFGVREDVAEILGVPQDRVVVEGTWVGGGFGGKAASLVEPYALVLAAASGRPVRLALSYREEFQLGRTTQPTIVRIETAVRGGRITGRRVRLVLDSGSSLPGRDFATGFAIAFLLGPYRVGAFEMEGYAIRTNKPPFGPHRAPLAPQCAFVVDSHMESIARRLGVDPAEFRRQHAWVEGDRTSLGQPVGPFGLSEALRRAQALRDRWRSTAPRGHGFGIGCGFWSTGTGAGGEARLRLGPDGLVITEGEREIGSGSVIGGLVEVAHRTLGLPTEAIRLDYADTASAPYDSGVYGSRTVAALGQAVEKACRALLKTVGERSGEGGTVSLDWKDGEVVVRSGKKSKRLSRLLDPAERKAGGLVAQGAHYGRAGSIDDAFVVDGTFYPYHDFTASVALAEVRVDRETGQVTPVRIAMFPDVGVALDPALVAAQVEGAAAMGLGTALTEELLWTPEGRLVNAGLLDYRVPTLSEIPPIAVDPIVGFLGSGPFGAKGVGEPPMIPVPAAIANAVADATGARVFELPLSPERVARALKLL